MYTENTSLSKWHFEINLHEIRFVKTLCKNASSKCQEKKFIRPILFFVLIVLVTFVMFSNFFLVPPPPVIKFTQPVYKASESGNAVVGVSVTDGKVTEPITVR